MYNLALPCSRLKRGEPLLNWLECEMRDYRCKKNEWAATSVRYLCLHVI